MVVPMAGLSPQAEAPRSCKAHIKDICFTRMYIGGHFDAPFEDFRLDQAVFDLVGGSGVPRSALLPLTCFLFKGYLWTLNNRRLWALRHAFMFTGADEEVDVSIIPESAFPERKDYITRLPFHKQESLISGRFLPIIHGDQPKLQRLVMRPVVFRFDLAMRSGYRMLPGNRLLCINAGEALAAFRATAPAPPAPPALPAPPSTQAPASPAGGPVRDDDAASVQSESLSVGSLDFPGRRSEYSQHPNWNGAQARLLSLPPLREAEEEGAKGAGDVKQVATNFKEAVRQLKLVLDGLDALLDTMITV